MTFYVASPWLIYGSVIWLQYACLNDVYQRCATKNSTAKIGPLHVLGMFTSRVLDNFLNQKSRCVSQAVIVQVHLRQIQYILEGMTEDFVGHQKYDPVQLINANFSARWVHISVHYSLTVDKCFKSFCHSLINILRHS